MNTDGVAERPEIIPDEPDADNTDVGILFINDYQAGSVWTGFSFSRLNPKKR